MGVELIHQIHNGSFWSLRIAQLSIKSGGLYA